MFSVFLARLNQISLLSQLLFLHFNFTHFSNDFIFVRDCNMMVSTQWKVRFSSWWITRVFDRGKWTRSSTWQLFLLFINLPIAISSKLWLSIRPRITLLLLCLLRLCVIYFPLICIILWWRLPKLLLLLLIWMTCVHYRHVRMESGFQTLSILILLSVLLLLVVLTWP